MQFREDRSCRYLLDENVARSVTRMLHEQGRTAHESRTLVGAQAADTVLEYLAATEGLVLVSHDRDFKGIISGIGRKRLRATAPTVWLRLPEVTAATRFRECLQMVEDVIAHALDRSYQIETIQVFPDALVVRYRTHAA